MIFFYQELSSNWTPIRVFRIGLYRWFIPFVFTLFENNRNVDNTLWDKNTYWFFIIRNSIVSIRVAKSSRFLSFLWQKFRSVIPSSRISHRLLSLKITEAWITHRGIKAHSKRTMTLRLLFKHFASWSIRHVLSSKINMGWKTHRLIFHRPQLELHDDFVVEIKRFRSFEGNLSTSKLNETIHCGRRDTPFERNIRRAIILVTNNDSDKIRRRQNRLLIVHKRFPIFQKNLTISRL